jgi:hypothetical protein
MKQNCVILSINNLVCYDKISLIGLSPINRESLIIHEITDQQGRVLECTAFVTKNKKKFKQF